MLPGERNIYTFHTFCHFGEKWAQSSSKHNVNCLPVNHGDCVMGRHVGNGADRWNSLPLAASILLNLFVLVLYVHLKNKTKAAKAWCDT